MLNQKIVETMEDSHRPLKAREIAAILGIAKSEVNSELYKAEHLGLVAKDQDYMWSLIAAADGPAPSLTTDPVNGDPEPKVRTARDHTFDAGGTSENDPPRNPTTLSVYQIDTQPTFLASTRNAQPRPKRRKKRSHVRGRKAQDALSRFKRQIGKVPRLTPYEQCWYGRHYQDSNEIYYRNVLIEDHLRSVVRLAGRMKDRTNRDVMDLIQDGAVGLIAAAERWDPSGEHEKFWHYALRFVRSSIVAGIEDYELSFRVSATTTRNLKLVKGSIEKSFPGTPDLLDLASDLRWSVKKVASVLEAEFSVVELDESGGRSKEPDEEHSSVRLSPVGDRGNPLVIQPNQENLMILIDLMNVLEDVLHTLTPREEQVIKLRFGIGDGTPHTLREIGRIFGASREWIRQIERSTLDRLRNPPFIDHLKRCDFNDQVTSSFQSTLVCSSYEQRERKQDQSNPRVAKEKKITRAHTGVKSTSDENVSLDEILCYLRENPYPSSVTSIRLATGMDKQRWQELRDQLIENPSVRVTGCIPFQIFQWCPE